MIEAEWHSDKFEQTKWCCNSHLRDVSWLNWNLVIMPNSIYLRENGLTIKRGRPLFQSNDVDFNWSFIRGAILTSVSLFTPLVHSINRLFPKWFNSSIWHQLSLC